MKYLARSSFKYYSSFPAFGKNTNVSFLYKISKFTQAQVKTLIEVFTHVQKQYKTAESCGTKRKDCLLST